MGNRDSVIGGYREGAGHARHNLEGDIVLNEQFQLLPAAAEQEGVSSLEAHDSFPLECLLQKCAVDLLLDHPVTARPLPDIDLFRLIRDQGQHSVADEGVIDNHFCLLKDFKSLDCKKSQVSRAGSHEPYFSCHKMQPL